MIKIEVIVTDPDGASTDISDFVGDISLSGSIKEATRSLDLTVLRSDIDKSYPKLKINLGDGIRVAEISNNKKNKVFDGVIWDKAIKDNSVSMELTCYDRAIYLNKNEPDKAVYTNKSAGKLAGEIISQMGLSAGFLAKTASYNYNLRNLSAYDAIMQAYKKESDKTGKSYKLIDIAGTINVYEQGKKHPVVIRELDWPAVGKILNVSIKESLDDLVNELKAIEEEKKDEKKQAGKDKQSQERYGKIQKVLKGKSTDVVGLMKSAKREVDLSCIGDWDMISGKSIEIKSPIVSGLFYIVSDRHVIDDAIHTVELKLSSELDNN